MGNISPQDLENSIDTQTISHAMDLDLQESHRLTPWHREFTHLAQLFGKEKYFPIPDDRPTRSGQGIHIEEWVLGRVKSIEPDSDNFETWRVSVYANGCRGILKYRASRTVLCQWLCPVDHAFCQS